MARSSEQTEVEPIFNVGQVADSVELMFPLRRAYLDGVSVGEILAPNVGEGSEVDGIRPYIPGDNQNRIDWRASARSADGELQVRLRQAEISPALWVVTDLLQSPYRSNAGYFSKRDLGLSAIMFFVKMAEVQGMAVGLVAADDQGVHADNIPSSGSRRALRFGHQLADLAEGTALGSSAPEERIYLSDALQHASKLVVRSAVLVVSGFRDVFRPDDETTGWADPLLRLAANGNDLTTIEITQPYNRQIPANVDIFKTRARRPISIAGAHEQRLRRKYAELSGLQQAMINDELSKRHIAHLSLATYYPLWQTSLRDQVREIASSRRQAD